MLLLVALAGCGGESAGSPAAPTGPVGTGPSGSSGSDAGGGGAAAGSTAAATGSGGGSAGAAVGYPIPDWPTGAPEDHGFDPSKLAAAAAVAESEQSYCLLVIRHGVIVDEHYWNGTDATTKSPSWSIAKSYTSALVGIALDRGEIQSLDQSVADYVPEWKGTDREAITIRHLLSMMSGLTWSVFQDYVSMATFAPDHTQFAVGLSLADPPGSKWIYHNGGVQILEPVIRAATGHTLEEYAEEHLWPLLGMTASWKHDPAGNDTAYANVLASCRDHARFGYLYLHGGLWETEQVISAAHVAGTITPSQTMNRAYGWLWWLNAGTPAMDAMMEAWPGLMVPFAPKDLFAARGFGNQFIDVIPSLDLMVVRFGPDPMTSFDLAQMAADSRFEQHDAILKPVLDAIVE